MNEVDRIAAKNAARDIMSRRLGSAVGADMLYLIMSVLPFLIPVAKLGLCRYYLEAVQGGEPLAMKVFEGFDNALRAFLLMLWQALFFFLWCVLAPLGLVLVGLIFVKFAPAVTYIFSVLAGIAVIVMYVIKSVQYSLAYFVMSDRPDYTARQCLSTSVAITREPFLSLLVAELSFLGWRILNVYTLNLLELLWLDPYMNLTWAGIFRQLTGMPTAGASAAPGGPGQQRTPPPPPPVLPGISDYTSTMRAQGGQIGLRGVSGMYSGLTFNLGPGETLTIGRDAKLAQIVISEGSDMVSRTHCRISFDQQQNVYLLTDESKNGTFLSDGTRLPPNTPNKMARGAVVCLGDSSNSFRLL